MKKITLLLFMLTFFVGAAIAQNADKKWAIGVGPGATFNKSDAGDYTEKNSMLDFYVSRYLNPSFDVMLDMRMSFWGDQWLGKSNTLAGYDKDGASYFGEGLDNFNPLLNLRYKFNNGYIFSEDAKIQPFLVAGLGYLAGNEESGVNFDAGLGVKVPVSPSTSLFVAGTYVSGVDDVSRAPLGDVVDNYMQVTSIVEFALGKAKDADGDGVPDRKDECPDTPPGVQVDEKGCPLDRDGDGVPDYKDDCPDEAGPAALNGCPDSDGDGVADKDDECPNEAGLAKFNGCPDSDEDGVPDHKDKCPDTPKGCPVDADGCPLDSDGDGVIDCEDDCPTVAGPASNNGCPDWSEVTIPAILFDFDSAELSADGEAELDKLASQLTAAKEFEIVIGGHTCDIGGSNYNMELSEKRAQAVVKYLLKKGVNNAYVGSNNYGEDKPVVPNNSTDNRKENRRAEFEVIKIRK